MAALSRQEEARDRCEVRCSTRISSKEFSLVYCGGCWSCRESLNMHHIVRSKPTAFQARMLSFIQESTDNFKLSWVVSNLWLPKAKSKLKWSFFSNLDSDAVHNLYPRRYWDVYFPQLCREVFIIPVGWTGTPSSINKWQVNRMSAFMKI